MAAKSASKIFAPNIEYILDLDTVQQLTEIEDAVIRLLQGWGYVCSGELRRLGYSRIVLGAINSKVVVGSQLTDDEVLIVDRIVTRLRADQLEFHDLLKMRFLQRLTIKQIGDNVGRSSKVVRKRLGLLNTLVYNLLAYEYSSKKRLAIAARVFGSDFVSSLQS